MRRDSSRVGLSRKSVVRTRPVRVPVLLLVRFAFLGSMAVLAAVWGVVSYYRHPHLPMLVPVPVAADAGAWDAGAGLIEAPEIER